MSQESYIDDLLYRFRMTDANPVITPMDVNAKLSRVAETDELEEDMPYRELVGCLTYLAIATRPDISFAVSCLRQFSNAYGKAHWNAAKRVLRYLKGIRQGAWTRLYCRSTTAAGSLTRIGATAPMIDVRTPDSSSS